MRSYLVLLLAFLSSATAYAEPHDVYPVSCDVLWAAVNLTLSKPGDYGVMGIDDLNRRASFVVVGDLAAYRDTVSVSPLGNGCAMKLAMFQDGPDDSNARGFRKRLKKSLMKVQAAAAPPPKTPVPQGQE